MDEIVRAKSAMDQTCWLRFLTDFKLLPSLVSMSEAKHVFSKYNFYLTPHKWDLRTDLHAPQSRPIGMAGATQFRTLSFSDFVAALLGITFTRASLFTVFPTKEQRVLALCCYMRKQAVDWNESLEVTRARDRETHSINSGDSKGRFLEHGKSTPSCLLKLQRMWGDHQTEYNWWLDYTTPESAAFEHRLPTPRRRTLGSFFMSDRLLERCQHLNECMLRQLEPGDERMKLIPSGYTSIFPLDAPGQDDSSAAGSFGYP